MKTEVGTDTKVIINWFYGDQQTNKARQWDPDKKYNNWWRASYKRLLR